MNYDELAFFNQQLAAMLRDGIPLEGALKQLCRGLKSGALREEMTQLENDLAAGTPLKEALARRKLPEFYSKMVELGARGNDLPGVLILLADHYQRANTLWMRLKGLMVYPVLVILVALGLTAILSIALSQFVRNFEMVHLPFGGNNLPSAGVITAMWMPPVFLAVAAVLIILAVSVPAWRARLRWRLPAFHEACLAQFASAMALMLKNGTPLPDALKLAGAIESASPAGAGIAEWRRLVESGQGKPAQWPAGIKPFPPMFLWIVQKGGENLAAGFEKAAEIYRARASYRIEMALYGALPVSILLLGQMVFWEMAPLLRAFIQMMNMLGAFGGGD
jgi:type IV pilus assembly protein PilC